MPHRIRLRGPWQYEPLVRYCRLADGALDEQTTDLPPGGRIKMPADWSETLGADFRGRVRYERRFSAPTGVEPGMRVVLVIDAVNRSAAVSLDERPLGAISAANSPWQCDIGEYLSGRHLLCVDVEMPLEASTGCGGLTGEVRLEIYDVGEV